MDIPPMTEPFIEPEFIPGQIMRKHLYVTGANEQYILNACHTFLPQCSQYRPTIEVMRNFKYADLYNEGLGVKFDQYDVFEKHKNKLGHIRIFGDPVKQEQQIINMFVQMFPQKPFFSFDSYQKRMKYFISSMNKVYKIKGLQSIAYPEKIACDIGSNWDKYLEILEKFAKKFPNVRSVMYTGAFFSKFKIVDTVVKKLDKAIDRDHNVSSKTLKSVQRMMKNHELRFNVKDLEK